MSRHLPMTPGNTKKNIFHAFQSWDLSLFVSSCPAWSPCHSLFWLHLLRFNIYANTCLLTERWPGLNVENISYTVYGCGNHPAVPTRRIYGMAKFQRSYMLSVRYVVTFVVSQQIFSDVRWQNKRFWIWGNYAYWSSHRPPLVSWNVKSIRGYFLEV